MEDQAALAKAKDGVVVQVRERPCSRCQGRTALASGLCARCEAEVNGDLSPEEEAELNLQRAAILAKRKAVNPRICRVCKQYAPNSGICERCETESAECPLCGNGKSKLVCRVCIQAGAPWCRYCRRVRPANADMCEQCQKDLRREGAANYPSPVIAGSVPSTTRVYEAPAPGAEMPPPTEEIPV
jgi:hypothetical protein